MKFIYLTILPYNHDVWCFKIHIKLPTLIHVKIEINVMIMKINFLRAALI